MVLEGIDDLVDEVAVGGGVPPEPVADVAVEAVAIEERRVVSVALVREGSLGGPFFGAHNNARVHGPSNHVSEDLTVFDREDGRYS